MLHIIYCDYEAYIRPSYLDVMYISVTPIEHIVHTHVRLVGTSFLQNSQAERTHVRTYVAPLVVL